MDFNKINLQDLQLSHDLEVNPGNGSVTGNVRIPLPEGRNGFGPELGLSYSSTPRNSSFGIGWSLTGISFICIDTNEGLPKYDGTENFAFNGGISLVPALVKIGTQWQPRVDEVNDHWIYYYRPIIEETFTRFEKWVSKNDRTIHWRTVSGDNTVSVYGKGQGKICNPAHEKNTFIWLLEEQFDNQGNAILIQYKNENADNIDPRKPSEVSRVKHGLDVGFSQKYPDRILYGNTHPVQPDQSISSANQWLFQVVFDYGEFEDRPYETDLPSEKWKLREDPFSVYNPGFEIRTYRLCRRILSYHKIQELSANPSLKGIFELEYNEGPLGTTVNRVLYTAVKRDLDSGEYSEKTLPPLSFTYTEPRPDTAFKAVIEESNSNVPQGFNSPNTRFVDLLGEGIPGILTETANNWYFKKNLGTGMFDTQETVISKPTQVMGMYSLGDFNQDGNLDLFTLQGRTAGFYEYDTRRGSWSGFRPFQNIPQVSNAKFVDVNADGFTDIIVETTEKLICYPFEGREGFGQPFEFAKPVSNGVQYAPMIGANLALDFYMADMTGDGLQDQVMIRNGRVEYFPNLGNGRFGEAILMDNPPNFDFEHNFDPGRIRLFDLDGSGTTDILYLGRGEIRFWLNAAGNGFIEGGVITGLPYIDSLSSAVILDLLGNGIPCLVWSNSLTYAVGSPIQYLELTGGEKPRLMKQLDNGIGAITQIIYGYSGTHYLESQRIGKPWTSKIPSHFTVADQKVVIDSISGSRIATTFKYYDGYYDGKERSFVCFGRIEKFDVESFSTTTLSDAGSTQPSCTKTWLHPGMPSLDTISAQQYYLGDSSQPFLTSSYFEGDQAHTDSEYIQGHRSLAGKELRQETFAVLPGGELEQHPFSVTQRTFAIRKIQPATDKSIGSFYGYQTEALEIAYDRNPDDPKLAHHLTLAVDELGNVLKEMSVAYARRNSGQSIHLFQGRDYITAGTYQFLRVDTREQYLSGILTESKSFEINHIERNAHELVSLDDVQLSFDVWTTNAVTFDGNITGNTDTAARLTGWDRTYYWNSSQTDVLPHGQIGAVVLAHHEETACFTNGLVNDVFSGRISNTQLSDPDEGNYILADGYWWQHTALNHYNNLSGFYTLQRVENKPGEFTLYGYDPYFLSIIAITDPLGNITSGELDYNFVEPYRMTDANDNVSEVLYDAIGIPVVTTAQGSVLHNGSVELYGNSSISDYDRRSDESFDTIIAHPELFLQNASTFLFYDLNSFPLRSIRLSREKCIHDGKGNIDLTSEIQIDLDYQDGFGRIIQNKRKAEPGPAIRRKADGTVDTDPIGDPLLEFTDERWLVSGHIVYNNKQLPIQQFEPFFSDAHAFENDSVLENFGVSIHQYYDAVGRSYRTDFPDATFSEMLFSPWEVRSYDQNDTVDRSMFKVFREIQPAGSLERMALDKSLAHKETPVIVQFDPLGRAIVKTEINNNGTVRKVETAFDIDGNPSSITDSRGLKAFEYTRDMLGRVLHERSMDAGDKWSFHNNYDQTIHTWDSRNVHQRTRYDVLDRIVSVHVDGALGLDHMTERFVYGEDPLVIQAKEKNLRGNLVLHYDQAGLHQLKLAAPGGLPLHTERSLLDQFTSEPDWLDPLSVALAPGLFVSSTEYDNLGRPTVQRLPDQGIREYKYNLSGGLQKIVFSTEDGVLSNVELLKYASYDAKGMRQNALMGNDVEMDYTYDRETFRMKRLRARRISGASRTYQDIRYTYDPVGNLLHLQDEAQQPASTGPQVLEGLGVAAHSEFEYDALYQLISASGRVHQALLQYDYADRSRDAGVPANWGKGTRHIGLNNGIAVERYTRTYEYDAAGNIKSIRHTGSSQNWTKRIWTSATSNRSLPMYDLNDVAISDPESRFDANGNCLYLPNLRSFEWNYRNNISRAVIIDRSAQGKPNDEEFYVYGGNGMRVRKITQRLVDATNGILELTEKIYLDGCEIKRITRGGTEILNRCTSTISDANNTFARIHSWGLDVHARETDDVQAKKIHYQLVNHLGSSALELDEQGNVITYEEYFPFGGTSFIAGRSKRDIDLKEYRYSAKERDDFTGLYYFGYRYYAHWMGGWINPDPLGPEDSENLYLYVHNNPINLVDPNGLQSTGDYRTIGTVRAGLTAEQAMAQFNRGQGIELGIRVLALERRGNNWIVTRQRNLTRRELENFRTIQEQWAAHPEIAEMFAELDFFIGDQNMPDFSGLGGLGGSGSVGTGNETGSSSNGSGEAPGAGDSSETSVNNGDGGQGTQTSTGDGVNPGDGGSGTGGTGGTGSGLGQQGAGTGGGGTSTHITPTPAPAPATGTGTGTGTATGRGTAPGGNAVRPGSGSSGGSGSVSEGGSRTGGQPGGISNGAEGGEAGGSADGAPQGLPGGDPRGGAEGNINGAPDGIVNGSVDGSRDGIESGDPNSSGLGTAEHPGTSASPVDGGTGGSGSDANGGRSGSGDSRTNWIDTATRWAGYLNLEFGGNQTGGEAGGVPGGLDLFGWRPPMWVRRTLQFAYIATTIITTVIPIGKAALAAKVAIQGMLKVGLRATARRLLTRAVAMIPSRAAIRGTMTSIKSSISSGISRLGGMFTRRGGSSAVAAKVRQRAVAPSSVVDTGFGGYRAYWSGDSKALVAFGQEENSLINITDIFRGGNPSGSAGQMVADSLRRVGYNQPPTIKISSIIHEETLEALLRSQAPATTTLGRTMINTVEELGGRITGWTTGVYRDKHWIQATISY